MAMAAMIALGAMPMAARDKVSRDINVLPQPARETLARNFKSKFALVKIEKDFGRVDGYEVSMTDGSEVKFDSKGNIKEIEMPAGKFVPSAFIPAPMASFVEKNHKGQQIVSLEKNRSGYEVELSGGIDIKFKADGAFDRYD